MSENLMKKALEIVKNIGTEADRYKGFVALVPYLPEELIPEALELVEGFKSDIYRCFALKALVPNLAKVTP